jgi:selenocysteine-specific elongation factor
MAKLIGTAGHVDHGKTTLIKALTGIDADRLPEEKQRGMTIDVGFAFLDLPGHGRVSIVDVPGHERFVTNMLVGALGIDVALLCVSCDEGVKPQTVEHLQILELLPVEQLVVALTRCDLADADTRELAALDVEDLVSASRFASARVVLVSAFTGEGLDELRSALGSALTEATRPEDMSAPWYLPIDRVFTVKGHGCVVTGTLAQGRVRLGEAAVLQPGGVEVRVRGVQTHGETAEASERGKRTALNLSGVKVEDVQRGMAVGAAGAVFESTILDARLRLVEPLKHAQRVRVSLGAEEVIAKAFLSETEPEVVQLRLETPVAVALNQPLIVRRYSPPEVLGGGRVLVPQARPRRRKDAFQSVQAGDDAGAILNILGHSKEGVPTEEICRQMGKTPQALGKTFEELLSAGRVQGFAGLWFSEEGWLEAREALLDGLRRAHEAQPTFATLPREKAVQMAGLPWKGKPLDRIVAALDEAGAVHAFGTNLRLPEFQVQLPTRQRQLLDGLREALEAAPVNTPTMMELSKSLGVPPQAVEEILKLGQQAGEVVIFEGGVYYTPKQLESLAERVREIAAGKPFGPSDLRDALGSSRKYIIPLLEHFDSQRITVRVGDKRVMTDSVGPKA